MNSIHIFANIILALSLIAVSSVNVFADTRDLGPNLGTEITLDGVTYGLYQGTAWVEHVSENKEHVVIPSKVIKNGKIYIVKVINDCAFFAWGKNKLKSVVLPNTLVKIGDYTFTDCKYLKSIEIPSNVIELGRGAFDGCIELESVTLLGSIISLPEIAFRGCEKLRKIVIPLSVEKIEMDAFSCCYNLEKVTLLNAYTKIHEKAFMGDAVIDIENWNGTVYTIRSIREDDGRFITYTKQYEEWNVKE